MMQKKGATVIPRGLIVCDEVRREDNGKFLAIGVYTDGVAFEKLPIQYALGFLFQFEISGNGAAKFEFELRRANGTKINGIRIEMDVNEETKPFHIQTMGIQKIPVEFSESGDISVFFRQADDDWQLLKVFPVVQSQLSPQSIPAKAAT